MSEVSGCGAGLTSFADLSATVRTGSLRTPATRVVAVDGPSGSGKTTFARGLGRALGVRVLHMDDIYPGWDGLAAGVAELCAGVLEPLGAGRAPRYRRWSWVRNGYAGVAQVQVGDVLVVEGVGSASRRARPWLTLAIWVQAPEPVRRARALARDGDTYAPHWQRWADQEAAHFAAEGTRGAVDLVVDGTARLADPGRCFAAVSSAATAGDRWAGCGPRASMDP